MSKKQKVIIIVAIALVSLVSTICVSGLIFKKKIVLYAKEDIAWVEYMNTRGPWSEKAIWKSSNDDFYLICDQDQTEETKRITVSAYIQTGATWEKCSAHYRNKIQHFFFHNTDDFTILECKANGKNNMLILTDIECNIEYFKDIDKITLFKYDYDEIVNSLPFELIT